MKISCENCAAPSQPWQLFKWPDKMGTVKTVCGGCSEKMGAPPQGEIRPDVCFCLRPEEN